MKKIAAFILFTAITMISFAQVRRNGTATNLPSASHDAQMANAKKEAGGSRIRQKQMMHQLHLTKLQRGRLKEMHQSAKAKAAEIKNDDKLSEDEKKTKLRALKKEQVNNTQSVLNDEQKAKLKQLQSEKRKNKKDMPEKEQ